MTTITNHRDDRTTWSTCTCGWTSSPNSSHHLEHQAEAHRRWCMNRNGETR